MVEYNHNVKNIDGTSVLVKGSHGVVVGVFVMIPASGSTLTFRNGNDASAPIEFTVNADNTVSIFQINRRFENGIFVSCSSNTVRALVVFK